MMTFISGAVCGAALMWACPKLYIAGEAWWRKHFASDEQPPQS